MKTNYKTCFKYWEFKPNKWKILRNFPLIAKFNVPLILPKKLCL
jgi:hypothetical protein